MEQLSQRCESQKWSKRAQVHSEVIVWNNRDLFLLSNNPREEKGFLPSIAKARQAAEKSHKEGVWV